MALMFQRLARNFVKHGYFPTDSDTLSRILSALQPVESGNMKILDPCCGEGTALAEYKAYLGSERVTAFGIDIDIERAQHAATLLDHTLQSDINDCVISQKSMGLLFLNPPYGDLVRDDSDAVVKEGGRQRLEKMFYQRTVGLLQPGGIMVLIIPYTVLDDEFIRLMARHFSKIRIHLAPEQRYHQCVIMGVRANNERIVIPEAYRLLKNGYKPPELPLIWNDEPYIVPAISQSKNVFASSKITQVQLAEVVQKTPCLWEQFSVQFAQGSLPMQRPLLDLSRWHLALALAAGQVSGLVTSVTGQRLLIKGTTFKSQTEKTVINELENGHIEEIRTLTDQFIPVIRALDVTPQSKSFGQLLTIR